MANEIKNERVPANFPGRFGKRENRASTHNYSCLVADSNYQLTDDDCINTVYATSACTITLPEAASNKGRVIVFSYGGGALTVAQNADAAAAPTPTLSTDNEWVELFCTGSEWLEIRSNYF